MAYDKAVFEANANKDFAIKDTKQRRMNAEYSWIVDDDLKTLDNF